MNSNKHPKISVIIPSYNHANFVGEAIESVLRQSYDDFELIIIDDCSLDNSVDIIDSYSDPRIRFYAHKKNMGAAYTINELIKLSRGEYIALLNSDDMWEKDKLQIQVNILNNSPSIGAVFSDALIISEQGDILDKSRFIGADIFKQTNRSSGKWLRRLFLS